MSKNKKTFPASRKFSPFTFSEERKLLQIAKEKVEVTDSGDSDCLVGMIISHQQVKKINKLLTAEQKKPPQFKESSKDKRERARAIQLLIYYNQHFVEYIARGYFSIATGVDYGDLVAEGIISLTQAIEAFDLDSPNYFNTYASFWIRQKMQAFFAKSQLIRQGSTVKEKKNILYYDEHYQSDDKDNKTYSLLDRLVDSDNSQLTSGQIYQKDTQTQVSNLLNSLPNREEILIMRLYHRIMPRNLVDIYHLVKQPEKAILKKELKIKSNTLPALDLSEKKCQKSTVVQKYQAFFNQSYTISQLATFIDKPESLVSKLRRNAFKQLQTLAKQKNFHSLFQ